MAKITYANKVTLNPQPSIADENKVTDDDMNEIKTVVNNNDNNVGDLSNLATNTKSSIVGAINELKNAEVYSTTEVKTNKIWIDSKPIYRKVIENTLPTISSSGVQNVNIPHNISNFESLVNISGYLIVLANSQIINFPVYTSAGNLLTIYEVNVNNIVLRTRNEGWSAVYGLKFIIEYTKTTD